MGVDETVWARVRRAHDTGNEPATQMCRRLGVSPSTYYKRRRRENWPPRSKLQTEIKIAKPAKSRSAVVRRDALKRPADDDAAASACKHSAAADVAGLMARGRLIHRLYDAIDQELQTLEGGADEPTRRSITDLERRTRTLTNMIRGFEKVLELDADKKQPKRKRGDNASSGRGGGGSGTGTTADDARRMRNEIAERLERLNTQWANQKRSGDAE